MLNIKLGFEQDFKIAFRAASSIISSMKGYLSHELYRCQEVEGKYLLLVKWKTVEAHTIGFREAPEYQVWKKLLHQFYEPLPTVEHFEQVRLDKAE